MMPEKAAKASREGSAAGSVTDARFPIVEVACPVCGRRDGDKVLTDLVDVENQIPGAYEVTRCGGCRLLYLSRKPTSEMLPSLYDVDYHVRSDRSQNPLLELLFRTRYGLRYRRIRHLLGRDPRSVMEIGCGDGRFLLHLEDVLGREARLVGVELDASTVRLREGSQVRLCDRYDRGLTESFDVILLYDVLEHLEHPVESLRLLRERLKPDGLIFLQVPNWNSLWRRVFPRHWGGLQVPLHQVYFDAVTLAETVSRSGLRLRGIHNTFDPGDLSVALSNWVTDRLGLRTRPRKAWFYYPLLFVSAPLVLLQNVLLRESGEIEAVAQRGPGPP